MTKTMGVSHSGEEDAMPLAVTPPRPLDFALSSASLRNIAVAEAAFDSLVDAHEASVGRSHSPVNRFPYC